jgi:alpha-L-rhamnosidase
MGIRANTAAWIVVMVTMLCACTGRSLHVIETFCNNKSEEAVVDPACIRFSWKLASGERNVMQTAYRIQITKEIGGSFSGTSLAWDSGRRSGGQSILVPYEGPGLETGTSYVWRVKAWDNLGNESPWSAPGRILAALGNPGDWRGAAWIGMEEAGRYERIVPGIHLPAFREKWKNISTGEHPLPLLRKEFNSRGRVEQALVFVSGLGQYELRLNGEKVSGDFLSPGWTPYEKYCFYNVYDITRKIGRGANCLGMILGSGFYSIPNTRYRKLIIQYGYPKMILMLRILYTNGSEKVVVSDDSWQAAGGPVTYSSIYGGEDYGATREFEGWDRPGFAGQRWENARLVKSSAGELVPETLFPVRVAAKFDPVSVRRAGQEGAWLYDFGQNASGIFEISLRGDRGDTVKLVPAELVTDDLEVDQRGSGSPSYCLYVLKGEGTEKWHPRFYYTGFRYIRIEGASPEKGDGTLPQVISLRMLHTRNGAPATGEFRTSDEMLTRINSLILWAIRSNMQSVLTDCPHREKLGWLEQSYLMGSSIHYNYDMYHLFSKVILDMIHSQEEDGLVPCIAPEYTEFEGAFRDSPEWGSACVNLPWLLYTCYGDTLQVSKAWDMMTRYTRYLERNSEGHILEYGLGDWNDVGPGTPGQSQLTPVALTSTAIYFQDLVLMGRMAALLGKGDTAVLYRSMADDVRKAFNERFFDTVSANYATGSQTSNAMPLELGLVDGAYCAKVLSNLVDSILAKGTAVTAGDVGNCFLVRALQRGGANQLIYRMSTNEDAPGYGYQLKRGATALTESWSALRSLSNNHLMLGHLMEWFYSGLAGIGQTRESVAYKEILIAPRWTVEIPSASAAFNSPYGLIYSGWERNPHGYSLEIRIPVNTHATIRLPDGKDYEVLETGTPSGEEFSLNRIGSGHYRFNIIENSDKSHQQPYEIL